MNDIQLVYISIFLCFYYSRNAGVCRPIEKMTTFGDQRRSIDSGIQDMETASDASTLTPFSSVATSPNGSVFGDMDEVDTVSAFISVGDARTESVTVGGDSDERQSTSAPVGNVSYDSRDCGSLGTISVNTYTKPDGPVPIPSVQVFVKTLRGNTVTCELNVESTVQDLMTDAFRKSGVPAEQQRLVFQGRNLNCGSDLLVNYGIKNHSTVHMMGRLRGGVDNNRSITKFGFKNNKFVISASGMLMLTLCYMGTMLVPYIA